MTAPNRAGTHSRMVCGERGCHRATQADRGWYMGIPTASKAAGGQRLRSAPAVGGWQHTLAEPDGRGRDLDQLIGGDELDG